ncbi:MAG: hypothetical protein DME96_06665, partial [Verrucomicrobia bacterium]
IPSPRSISRDRAESGRQRFVGSLPSLGFARQETVNLSENTPGSALTDEVNYIVFGQEKQKDYSMRKLPPTLTQSGLLAVLLQRQRYRVIQLARRRAQRKHVRAALWNTLTWPYRALTASTLVGDSAEPLCRNRPASPLNLSPGQ